MDMDDEGTGQLSSTNLHPIIAAPVEGHDKCQLAYHAFRNNYTSLMCSSYLGKHPHRSNASSLIFMQQKIMSNTNLSENTISLSIMRSAIHKVQPENLEYSIFESSITTSGTNGEVTALPRNSDKEG